MRADGFDELIHNPIRLRLCVLLMPAQSVQFATLRDELGVADSVLSKHLKVLIDADHVTITRVSRPTARSVTAASLTAQGREALTAHLQALRRLADQAEGHSPAQDPPSTTQDPPGPTPGGPDPSPDPTGPTSR